MGEPVEEAARFSSFSEASVACSALKAAGVDAVLLDSDPVAGAWREPYGQGGFRIGAPADQVAQVRRLLRQFEAEAPVAPPPLAARPTVQSASDNLGLARLILIGGLFLAIAVAFVVGRL